MSELLMWMLIAFVYCLLGGMSYKMAEIRTGETGYDNPAVFFSGVLWPIVAPAYLGSLLVVGLGSQSRQSRASRKRASEIEAAEHKRELARIAAEELAISEWSLNIK